MEREGASRQSLAIVLGAGLTLLAWVLSAIAMSGRGLDITDESFYLLSYRWWNTNPYTFTGVQYLFGPIYEAIGYHVQGLRLVRVFLIVIAHVVLGLNAASWITATTAPTGRRSRVRNAAIVLAVISASGIVLAWGPLSPGYNDVGLLASVLMAAGVLSVHAAVIRNRVLPALVALWVGPVIVSMALAKWSSALIAVPFVFVMGAIAVWPHRPSGGFRWMLMLLVSTCASVGIFHLVVAPLPEVIDPIVAVTGRLSAGTNAPTELLAMYAKSTARVVLLALLPVLLVGLPLALLGRTGRPALRRASAAAPLASLAVCVWLAGGISGGVQGIQGYVVALLTICAATMLAVSLARRQRVRRAPGSAAVLVLLATLPGVQALGTGNPLFTLAVNGFAMWMVVLLAAWEGLPVSSIARSTVAVGILTAMFVVCWVSVTGVLIKPYRTESYVASTDRFESPATGTLLLSPKEADGLRQIQAAAPHGSPTMAFDEMAGVILALDGRPVGEAWYSASDHERTAAGIRTYCEDRDDPWNAGLPVIVFNRPSTNHERSALISCALSIDDDFRSVQLRTTFGDLHLYLPREDS